MKYVFLFLIAINAYSKSLVGTVYDGYTNEVVSDVKLIVNNNENIYYTDNKGIFEIPIDDNNVKIHIDLLKSGYSEKHLNISKDLDSITIFLVPLSYDFDDITVTDMKIANKAIQSISEAQINEGMTKSMSSILRNNYGINSVEMGEAVSRPVLNGLSGNRLTIVNNNFTAKDLSANSVDHSQAYTLNNAKNISIIYGPDLIRYGSSLVGKSIKTTTNLTTVSKIKQNSTLLSGSFGSVNNKISFATKNEFDFLLDGLVLNGIYTKTGNVISPEGTLKNTSYNLVDVSAATYYQSGEFSINPFGSYFKKNYGIPGGFTGAHPNGVDIEMIRNSFGLNSEYHLHGNIIDKMNFQFERSFYDHKEYEDSGLLGVQFRFVANSARFELAQHQGTVLKSGYMGIAYTQKDNQLGGFVFIPNNNYQILSSYLNEEIALYDNLGIKTGIRYELTSIDLARSYDYQNKVFNNLDFSSISGAVLFDYEINEKLHLLPSISLSNRAPEPEELFSNGPHLAAYSYDIGNPELNLEKSVSYSLNAIYENEFIRLSSELFYYDYSNFITPVSTGDTNYSTLLPIYRQTNMAADIYGINFSSDIDLSESFKAGTNISYTIGKESKTNHYLPMIPPLSMNVDLQYKIIDWEFQVVSMLATSQENLNQFETRTDGYIILNAQVKRIIDINSRLLSIIVSLNNLTNATYRNHLSRIKSIYPQAGIGAELIMNFYL